MALGRVLLMVVGFDQQHWSQIKKFFSPDPDTVVDVTIAIPHDPHDKVWKTMSTVDSVIRQTGFPNAVKAVLTCARKAGISIVGCRRGKHRSPVVGGTGREILMSEGYSVMVLEVNLVQPELIQQVIAAALDWQSEKRLQVDLPSSYSLFQMWQLVERQESITNLQTLGFTGHVTEGRPSSASSSHRAHPYTSSHDQPRVSWKPRWSQTDDSTKPTQGVSDEVKWYIDTYNLDEQATTALKNLGETEGGGEDAQKRVCRKLHTKSDAVRKPSAFVTTASKNAIAKLVG